MDEKSDTGYADCLEPDNVALGSCDDGLDDPTVDYAIGNGWVGRRSSGEHYTVQDGGQTVTIHCSPSAAATSDDETDSWDCWVTYSVSVSPLDMELTGGIGPNGSKRYLVGQQCSATLETGGLTASTHIWTVSGGEPFKDWTASDAYTQFTPMGSETDSSLTCHFKKPDTASISCTIDLTVPAGAQPAGGFSGIVLAQQATIEKPSAQLDVQMGAVTDLPSSSAPDYIQLQRFFYSPPSGDAAGIEWTGTITTSTDYVTSGDYGRWNWTQLITTNDQRKYAGTWQLLALNNYTPPKLINGLQTLDNTYPYGYFWYPANGNPAGNADSPAEPLEANSSITAKDILDSFDDYLMYQPPGDGSLPVPLKDIDWFWEGHATKNGTGVWSTSGKTAQWSLDDDFPDFPAWTFPLINGNLVYVNP